jgi:hypothetical protein
MSYLNFKKASLLLLFEMLVAILVAVHIEINSYFIYSKEFVEKNINFASCFS